MVSFEPCEYMRKMSFLAVSDTGGSEEKKRIFPVGDTPTMYDLLVTSSDALPLSHRRRVGT